MGKWEDFKYNYIMSLTRDFSEVGTTPLIDYSNTENNHTASQHWWDVDQSAFCLRTEVAVSEGDEVTCDYGQSDKDPYMMFAQYAFVLGEGVHPPATESAIYCEGLRNVEKDEVFQEQNGVAANFASFAKTYCSDRYLRKHYGESVL